MARAARRVVLALISVAVLALRLATEPGYAAAIVGTPQPLAIPVVAADMSRAAFRQPDTIPFPADNLYTLEKGRLGRALFFDPRLSRSGTLSCSSCHSPANAYGDRAARSIGAGQTLTAHRSPTIINSAWNDLVMWDGRFDTLETQALASIQSRGVMDLPLPMLVERLEAVEGYRAMFQAAFPGQPISGGAISNAIATYERTIVSQPSPFDAWISGTDTAISGAARLGFAVFTGKGNCVACHGGPTMSDNGFHDIGLPDTDPGRGKLLPSVAAMQYAFKTPGLRDIGLRSPYMHDGSLPTLEAVVAHYNAGGLGRPGQAQAVRPLGLTPGEQSDLVAFLHALSSPARPAPPPNLPHWADPR